jgi:hypothetical protein
VAAEGQVAKAVAAVVERVAKAVERVGEAAPVERAVDLVATGVAGAADARNVPLRSNG